MAERYGDIVYFGSWRTPIFFVNHPKLVREVLISRTSDFVRADAVRNALRVFDGESILVREGDLWRQQRRLLQHGFRPERLRSYARWAVQHTQEMLERWPANGVVHAGDEMSRLCLKTLSDVLFGTQPPPDVAQSIRTVLDARAIETGRALASGLRPPAGLRRKRDQALAHVHGFLDELIDRRRTEGEDQGDLLSMLVRASQKDVQDGQSRRPLDRQIRDETISMINASLDATAAAMGWTLMLVATHAATQSRLRHEIQQTVGEHTEVALDSAELPLTEMAVHESLRLYPPNWVLIVRRCVRKSTIGGYHIPRGSWLYIFPYVIHRDARWFAAPESFDPDRFAPDCFGPLQKSAYIPLGLGPHVCLGKALSTILLTSIVARILQDFRLALPEGQTGVEPEVGVVMRPKNGFRLVATRHSHQTG
jgi:cytochrome P450